MTTQTMASRFFSLALATIAIAAHAQTPPAITTGVYPTYNCTRVGPACVSKNYAADRRNLDLNVEYNGYLTHEGRPLSVGVVLNHRLIGTFNVNPDRGGYTGVIPGNVLVEDGELELFFFDGVGRYNSDSQNYDSNEGSNYAFMLSRSDDEP